MQALLQLNPPIPMNTPKGEGLATLVIDYGPDYDLLWTVIISKGEHAGEIWTYPNPQVRGVENITLGRHVVSSDARPTNGHDGKGSMIDKSSLPEPQTLHRLGLTERSVGQRREGLSSRLPGVGD